MSEKYDFTAKERDKDALGMSFFYSTPLSRRTGMEFRDRLRKLVIIGQPDISYLPAISELIDLEELWIAECGIKVLISCRLDQLDILKVSHPIQEPPSLQSHTNLEKLCLYMNKLESIPNLAGCTHLTILHMSNNNIRDFKNLDKIPSLQKLILADNKIERLGKDFPSMSQLRFINLSGNPLYRIQDVKNLAVLQKLNSLVFSDPLYKACPISVMCNYRPYVIEKLPHIEKLDHYPVCRGEKQWVAYFFREQASYYNMLLHTHFNLCLETLKCKYAQYRQMIRNLKGQFYAAHEERDNRMETKRALRLQLRSINEQVEEWEQQFMLDLKIYKQQFDLCMLSCGNISFVEYSPNDKNRVVDLCQSILEDSLCSNTRKIGITGIVLHKVVKVMSHEITNQFDWGKKSDIVTFNVNNVVFEILSSYPGIQSVEHWPIEFFESELFKTDGILVTDCLAIADADWLSRYSSTEKEVITNRSYKSRRICILIQTSTSAQPKRIAQKKGCNHIRVSHNHDSNKICREHRLEADRIKSPMFVIEYQYTSSELVKSDSRCVSDEDNNVIREEKRNLHVGNDNIVQMSSINQGRAFHLVTICLSGQNLEIIDLDLDLPNLRELDVSYNRITTFPNGRLLKNVKSLDISFNNIEGLSITEVLAMLENVNVSWNNLYNCLRTCQTFINFTPNLRELNIQYNPFEDCLDQKEIHSILKAGLSKLNLRGSVSFIGFHCPPSEILSLCTECTYKQVPQQLATHPTENDDKRSRIKPKDRQDYKQSKCIHVQHDSSLVSCIFKKKSKVESLCASHGYLMKIPITKPMKFLTKLNLSSNFISRTDNLTQQNFPVLKYLDLSKNLITSLRPMLHFHSLKEFYCAHNCISNISEVENLRSWYMLNILDLYKNPVDANDLCKKFIICHLHNIKYISGKYIQYTEILEAKYAFGIVLDVNVLSCIFKADYLRAITQLSLTNCSLKKIHIYSDMIPYLESLNLSRNKISMVWGLHSFQHLHTLCLSYNALESFGQESTDTASYTFLSLRTLMLDHNNLDHLESLSKKIMPKIKYLFLNDNNIHTLDGITRCPSLEALILDCNNLKTLAVEFQEESNLTLLSLEYNKLQSLQFVRSFKKLERLYLANNSITNEVDIEILKSLKNLKELTLMGNPIHARIFENDGFKTTDAIHWISDTS